jgi:hypothetical protein
LFPAASPEVSLAPAGKSTSIDDIARWGIVAAYAALQIVLTIWHYPWLDEAQAWLWAEQLSRPIDFFIIPSEGHPPLWYWLLRALSSVLDFTGARYVSTLIAIVNAYLLSRLLRDKVPLLLMMLASFALTQSWGYHFRPYNLIFTGLICTLLLDRRGHGVAATWVLAMACGLHLFTGILFAFWLVWQWTKSTPLLKLLPPALLAAGFGALAVLSGLTNTATVPPHTDVVWGTLYNLAWFGMVPPVRSPWLAIVTVVAVVYALRKKPLLLVTLLTLMLAFAAVTAGIYGKYPWHQAFMTMLCFMAFSVAGLDRDRTWVMILLLLPQVIFGALAVNTRLRVPTWQVDIYQVIKDDAGADFRPERDLVAWPNLSGVAISAIYDVKVINGNDGTLLGPADWRTHDKGRIDQLFYDKPAPFWLVCADCDRLVRTLEASGRVLVPLANKYTVDAGEFFAYRIDR